MLLWRALKLGSATVRIVESHDTCPAPLASNGGDCMAKYGLAQIDLNLLVQMSLAGLIDEPEQHLANLLRSRQPIEARTRQALVDVLDGRLPGSRIRVTQTKQGKFVRRFRNMRRQLKVGQQVSEKMKEDSLSYDQAVAKIAGTCGRSDKWVQSAHTQSNKLMLWIDGCRTRRLNLSDAALEMAFIYSTLKDLDPVDGLKPTVELLAKTVLMLEEVVIDAEGIWRPFPRR